MSRFMKQLTVGKFRVTYLHPHSGGIFFQIGYLPHVFFIRLGNRHLPNFIGFYNYYGDSK